MHKLPLKRISIPLTYGWSRDGFQIFFPDSKKIDNVTHVVIIEKNKLKVQTRTLVKLEKNLEFEPKEDTLTVIVVFVINNPDADARLIKLIESTNKKQETKSALQYNYDLRFLSTNNKNRTPLHYIRLKKFAQKIK